MTSNSYMGYKYQLHYYFFFNLFAIISTEHACYIMGHLSLLWDTTFPLTKVIIMRCFKMVPYSTWRS